MEETKLSINQIYARAFINVLNQTVAIETSPLFQIDRDTGRFFSSLTDAHMSVLSSIRDLVTNNDEVFAEYDRLLAMCRERVPGSTAEQVMTHGRNTLAKLLEVDAINH